MRDAYPIASTHPVSSSGHLSSFPYSLSEIKLPLHNNLTGQEGTGCFYNRDIAPVKSASFAIEKRLIIYLSR